MELIKPNILIFGKEFEFNQSSNIKKAIIKQTQFKKEVQFIAGETQYASTELLYNNQNDLKNKKYKQFREAINNQGISVNELINNIDSMKNCKLIVLGDVIIDQYSACEALGVSAEAPVMVVKELSTKNFLGGAAIVASHKSSWC